MKQEIQEIYGFIQRILIPKGIVKSCIVFPYNESYQREPIKWHFLITTNKLNEKEIKDKIVKFCEVEETENILKEIQIFVKREDDE